MISFRKRAFGNTGCPISFLGGLGPHANPSPRLAALIIILLLAAVGVFASPRQKEAAKAQSDGRVAGAPQSSAREAAGRGEESDGGAKIPIRVSRLDTPDGPYIVATIGDFPTDLDGRRQEFLRREFFEHFAKDVLEIGDPDSSATLKVSMLPQEKDNQREGDFTSGKLSGHMIVLVEKRRVMVACSFAEVESQPRFLAAIERFAGARVSRVSGSYTPARDDTEK
jgi:hypothetical protein